jgi:hypothetical protein
LFDTLQTEVPYGDMNLLICEQVVETVQRQKDAPPEGSTSGQETGAGGDYCHTGRVNGAGQAGITVTLGGSTERGRRGLLLHWEGQRSGADGDYCYTGSVNGAGQTGLLLHLEGQRSGADGITVTVGRVRNKQKSKQPIRRRQTGQKQPVGLTDMKKELMLFVLSRLISSFTASREFHISKQ